MLETEDNNNNCEPRDHDDDALPRGRFAIAPTSSTSELRRRKVSVVTLVEGQRKTSIYNWVNITVNQNVSTEDGFASWRFIGVIIQ